MAKIQYNDSSDSAQDVGQQELSVVAGGNANAPATLEDALAGSHKLKYNFI